MNTITTTKNEARTDVGYEASRFTLGVGIAMSALIGLWGVACLIGGLAANGPVGLIQGYITAIFGG
ncbi:MAG: hypothetical protein GQ559_12815 [Desulfobulbaceae bacterium]|nr:hypothetical protein [Desulfobulbaceae bacterium]